jgi:dTDP-4-amino-4,6-dideoxygalactose transaminase
VHIAGGMCNMDEIVDMVGDREIPIIEDCAHAFPVSRDGRMAGSYGKAGMFSFYATKTITTGEGGMVVTDDDEAAHTMRTLRLHGIDRPVWDRYSGTRANAWEYDVVAPGYKYNMTDIAAAIGNEQLKKANLLKERRTGAALRYIEGMKDFDFLTLPKWTGDHAWHLFIVQIVPEKLSIDRDRFIEHLRERGIHASVHFKPLHLLSYYRKTYGLKPEDFPRATERYQRVISLPLFADIREDQVDRVIAAVKDIGMRNRKKTAHASR